MEMYLLRIDLVSKMVYNNTNLRLVKWIKFMSAKNMDEMKKIAGEDENMNQAIKYIENFLKEEGTTFQDKIDYEKEKVVIETARKCLKKNLSISDIMEITGLSKQEIEELN